MQKKDGSFAPDPGFVPVAVPEAAVNRTVVQEVRLTGIANFACWWFVILSMLALVAGIAERVIR